MYNISQPAGLLLYLDSEDPVPENEQDLINIRDNLKHAIVSGDLSLLQPFVTTELKRISYFRTRATRNRQPGDNWIRIWSRFVKAAPSDGNGAILCQTQIQHKVTIRELQRKKSKTQAMKFNNCLTPTKLQKVDFYALAPISLHI